jgi:predicted AAA+ superfamily ATPase
MLIGLIDKAALLTYPKLGASWECVAIEEIIRAHHARAEDCYFWRTQAGAELDLCIEENGKLLGFECKYTSAPKLSPSMLVALHDLKLEK